MQELQLFINGQWVKSSGNVFIEVENPATRQIIAKVPAGNKFDVDLAVASANKAFPIWKNYTPNERADLLYKVADYLEKNKNEIAEIIIEELGAPQKIALDWHVESSIAEARYFADMAREFEYETKKKRCNRCERAGWCSRRSYSLEFPLRSDYNKGFSCFGGG